MKNYKIILFLLVGIIISCDMGKNKYEELSKHSGSDNYEVVTVIPNKNLAKYLRLDTISHYLYVKSYFKSIDKEKNTYKTLKLDNLGNQIDEYGTYDILNDGTMKAYGFYSDWIINGDKSKYDFINPLPIENQKDSEKWLSKFKELYTVADYVYESSWNYYFKIDNKWHELKYNLNVVDKEFISKYPAKEDQDRRMAKLRDLCPDFSVNEYNRDTSFMNVVDYEETDSEDGGWFNPISYSAGYFFIELYMPMGDTIKIKRHGSMGANLEVYKIPVTHGGRNDVVFLVQKPSKLYPEKEFGGMYVVRPRSLEQDEYGTNKSSADSFSSQYNSRDGNIDVVAKFVIPEKDE